MLNAGFRAALIGLICLFFVACGDDEPAPGELYSPCDSEDACHAQDGEHLRCVVSPYGGSTEGFCSRSCSSESDDPENRPILAGGCYPATDGECWLGCCHINNGWGGGGNGMCMPWAY